jgi:hypothetical protein
MRSVFITVNAMFYSLSNDFYESTSIKVDALDLPGASLGAESTTESGPRDLIPVRNVGRNLAELRIPFDVIATLVDFQRMLSHREQDVRYLSDCLQRSSPAKGSLFWPSQDLLSSMQKSHIFSGKESFASDAITRLGYPKFFAPWSSDNFWRASMLKTPGGWMKVR